MSAWIDTNGKIIICPDSHDRFAREHFGDNDIVGILEKEGVRYPYQLLHKKGWVRVKIKYQNKISVLGDCCSPQEVMQNTMSPAMNPRQISTVKKLCEKYDTEFLDAIN